MNTTEKKDKLAVILIAVFCFILYFNSLWNIFAFDDRHMITNNLYIKDLRYLPLFFKGEISSYPIPKGMLRPLLMTTFSFNYIFSKLQPLGYHIVNIAFHFLNATLLYILLRFLIKGLPYGLILSVVFLFCSHPINTEAVTYISSRSDLMTALLVGAGFLLYLKKRYLFSLSLYSTALLTKETAIAFPALVASYDFIFLKMSPDTLNVSKYKNKFRAYMQTISEYLNSKKTFYIGLVILTLLYLFYRKLILIHSADMHPLRSIYSNILTQSVVTLFYLRLFLWPYPLTLHHAFPIFNSLLQPMAIFSVSALAALVILIIILRNKYSLISLGLSWYLACLIPKFYARLNFVATEHHFYLSSFGIYIILAVLCRNLYVKFRRQFIYAVFCILGVFTILVWFRNYEWRDGLTLWKAAVKRDPRSATAHNNLGVEYMRSGFNAQSEAEFKKALTFADSIASQINPRGNLAALYRKQKRYAEAIELLNESFRIKQDYYSIYHILGIIYMDMGQEEKAEETWKKGLSFYAGASDIQVNLGILYLKRRQLEEAKKYFQAAIDSDPDSSAGYFGLGKVLEEEDKVDLAAKAYDKSIRLNPGYALAHYNLGSLYARKGDRRALGELKAVVELSPDFAQAHNNLAVLYASMEPPQVELARQHAKKALGLGYKVEEGFLKVIDLPNSK